METMGNLRRTRYCGEVRLPDAGQEMVVAGSIAKCRDKGGIIFADLRDTTGILQLVFDDGTDRDVFAKAQSLRSEYVVIAMAYCDRLLLLKEGRLVGELDMRRAKADEVKKKLSLIYGDIELLQSGDSFLMGKAL